MLKENYRLYSGGLHMKEIKESGFVKILIDGSAPTLHYIYDNNKVYSLTLSGSNKVGKIKNNNKAKIVLNNDSENALESEISIIDNKDRVKELFNKMLEMDFTHFKEFDDDIVILEMAV
eukprot:Anaeramoba_ignava/a234474_3.p1 GENE.a234474_3~~a234474_3.p1  ORF type:complete len:119 (+),score=18.68 a234474_3:38-394(+)